MKIKFLLLFILISGCEKIHSIPFEPTLKSSEWCENQPCFEVNGVTLNQPTSSILVFLLAFLTVYAGYYFLKTHNNYQSRKWWGYSLISSGIGAFLAGISYQLFAYELKCSGQEYCNWTNWFEVFYNITTVMGASCLLIGVAYSCFHTKWLRLVKIVAGLKLLIYLLICLIGAFVPNKFLISYEFLVIFSTPVYLLYLIINIYQYLNTKSSLFKYLSLTWISLFGILIIYYIYLFSGLTESLWKREIWFSANDILHVLMILWIIYIWKFLSKHIIDMKK